MNNGYSNEKQKIFENEQKRAEKIIENKKLIYQ